MLRSAWMPLLLGATLAGGCGPSRHEVSGRVAYDDGKPFVGGGIVVLEGTVDGKAVMARGAIGPDGRFTMSFGKPGQGVMAGKYRVRLVPSAGADVDGPTAKLPYDAKFLDCDTSGITLDVGPATGALVISLGPPT